MCDPHPADHEDDAQVLEQQRDPDRQVLHGVEEAGLGTRDSEQTERSDHAEVAPQDVPVPTQRQRGGHRQQQGGDADPCGDRGLGRPAGVDQRPGERAGGAEGHGRQQCQSETGARRTVLAHGPSPLGACNE
jgi:hypothetical protein